MKIAAGFGGGGAKGAFELGVVRGMQRKVDEYVCAFGCSTGSLVSTCIGTGELDFGERVYTKVQTGNIIKPILWDDVPILGDALPSPDFPEEVMLAYAALKGVDAMYEIEPLMELIDSVVDFKALKNSDVEVGFLTTESDSLTDVFFSSKRANIAANTLRSALLASISIPIYMRPVKIPHKRGRFVDGGLTRHIPGAELLKAKRYKEADVVMLVSPRPKNKSAPQKRKDDIYGTLVHTIAGLTEWNDENSFQRDILIVKAQAEKDGKLFIVVQPDYQLPIANSLRFVPEEMTAAYNIGLAKAKEINKLL